MYHRNGKNKTQIDNFQYVRSILDRQRITNATQMKVTKMLLVISTVFVILNLPSYVIRVWIFIVSVSSNTEIADYIITLIPTYIVNMLIAICFVYFFAFRILGQ